jgi:hypothetical protein
MTRSKRNWTVAAVDPALADFNERNREFWARQKILMDRRMADRAILETAVEAIDSETKRHVAIRSQKSFEEALQDAERAKRRFVRQQARSGGKAAKADSLQMIITDIVQKNPEIAVTQLLLELRKYQGDGIIDEIDETHIYFRQSGAAAKPEGGQAVGKRVISDSAPISGLKHRVTRARKKVSKKSGAR